MTLLTPEYLQTKKYTAKRDRAALAHGGAVQPGVWDGGDLKVSWTSGMNLGVAQGYALVKATNAGNLGLYHVQNDFLSTSVTIPPSHASLPRLDQVYILVNDSTDGGASDDTPQVLVAQGTATAGATLDNRNGAATLPANTLRLADVLVPAGAVALSVGAIRDRRSWARGIYRVAVRNANAGGGTNYTTASTSLVDIDATNLKGRFECSGNLIRVSLAGESAHSVANGRYIIAPTVDGALPDGSAADPFLFSSSATATFGDFRKPSWDIAPSAGSHLIGFAWFAVTAGTITLLARSDAPVQMIVEAILRPNVSND